MDKEEETRKTIEARLQILSKSLISEENSVQYYQSLLTSAGSETEEKIGQRRMYEDLQTEEKKHVQVIRDMITHWKNRLKTIE